MMHKPSISEADKVRFLSIPGLMGSRLASRWGRGHPDTLHALLTAFAPSWYIDKVRAAGVSAELRRRLHDPKVRLQRLVECIQIEEELGWFQYRPREQDGGGGNIRSPGSVTTRGERPKS
ncbi:hypothetical protein PG994_002387 [Apiospora phragmitis]|uniref:Uncharacterized protein n=1 Tax=Apiospora phragmitis TaxID=2905665 RepID=A0ABR1WW80_9PEZI